MKNLFAKLFLAGNLAICGCYNNEKEEMREQICKLKEKATEDSLAYSNLEKENVKILELCGKDKERVQKKNKNEKRISYVQTDILKGDEKPVLEKEKIDSNYNYQKENKRNIYAKFYVPDSISLIQEEEKINKNFLAFISANGEYDRKMDGTMDENKIWYFKRVNFKNISINLVKGINLKTMTNHMEANWEIWNDENADGKIDGYGKENLTEREEPFESFLPEKQKEISKKLTKLKAEIMEDANWKY